MTTDTQLKQALAQMLPDKLRNNFARDNIVWTDTWKDVLDSELLHLCWLVEETLLGSELQAYYDALKDSERGTPSEASLWIHHAIWQQRVDALCKVKGIEP